METPVPENVPPPIPPPALEPPLLAPGIGPVSPGSASIKITLAEMKWLIGLKSITFLLDGQPLSPIPNGGTGVFGVSPGRHTIQTIMKGSSWLHLFITITRRSAILTVSVAPNTQVAVMARHSRAWGNLELRAASGSETTGTPAKGPEALIRTLKAENLEKAVRAATALGQMKDPGAAEALVGALEDDRRVVRGGVAVALVADAAVEALGQMGEPAVDLLCHAVTRNKGSKDWLLRLRACKALGLIHSVRSTPYVIKLLADREGYGVIRDAAVKTIVNIGPAALPYLLGLENHEDALVRTGVGQIRATLGDSQGTKALMDALRGADLAAKKAAIREAAHAQTTEVVQAVALALKDEDKDVRAYAMQSLVVMGAPAEEFVNAALTNQDPASRQLALTALRDVIQFGDLKGDARAQALLSKNL